MKRKNPVKQCKTCPWKRDTRVADIPGYEPEMHARLEGTIAEGLEAMTAPMMACHHTPEGGEGACAGWLYHALNNNNIAMRIKVIRGLIGVPEIDGPQVETFEETKS